MNKKTQLILSLICLVAILFLIGFTKPSINSGWLIVVFFVFHFGFTLFSLQSIGYFIGLDAKRLKKVAFITTCIISSGQILITFQALRPIELILISSVLGLIGWYTSKAKS